VETFLIEVVTGQPYLRIWRAVVHEPLQMSNKPSYENNNPPEPSTIVGFEAVRIRFQSADPQERIAALNDTEAHGSLGLQLQIDALSDLDGSVRSRTRNLLRQREETEAKQALQEYVFWNNGERAYGYPGEATLFAGCPVVDFDPEVGITDPVSTSWAIRGNYDMGWPQYQKILESLLTDPGAPRLEALVLGEWVQPYEGKILDTLVEIAPRLPGLKALFVGDMASESCEISWIVQGDYAPILTTFLSLETLRIRGGTGLEISPCRHEKLKSLTIETGGLPGSTIGMLCGLDLPNLQYLELWLGSKYYGGDSTLADLEPILSGRAFPKLRYLGLRNAEYTDEIAQALTHAPVIEQLVELDLSMGNLTDEGAIALIDSPAVQNLDVLDLIENYLRDSSCRFEQLPCLVRLDDQRTLEKWEEERHCSVTE
jgi:hypothetical protein